MPELENEDIVEFDTSQKLIKVKSSAVRPDGILMLKVIEDIYRAARRWEASEIGIVYPETVSREGGNVLPGGVVMPVHVILKDGWKVQCPNNCNSVEIYGHLSSSDGEPPFSLRPDGHRISYSEMSKVKRKNNWVFISSILLLVVALGIISRWIYCEPNEMEPYSAFVIVLFTLVQLIGHSKNA